MPRAAVMPTRVTVLWARARSSSRMRQEWVAELLCQTAIRLLAEEKVFPTSRPVSNSKTSLGVIYGIGIRNIQLGNFLYLIKLMILQSSGTFVYQVLKIN